MMPTQVAQALILAWLFVAAAGCAQHSGAGVKYSYTQFQHAAYEDVYQAAGETMQEYFTLDQENTRTGVVRSVPSESDVGSQGDSLSRIGDGPAPVRRVAEFHIQAQNHAVAVSCVVAVQRNEHAPPAMMLSQNSGSDVPNQTPLQESRGLDVYGKTSWSAIGYDHALEKEMLTALSERLEKRPARPAP